MARKGPAEYLFLKYSDSRKGVFFSPFARKSTKGPKLFYLLLISYEYTNNPNSYICIFIRNL